MPKIFISKFYFPGILFLFAIFIRIYIFQEFGSDITPDSTEYLTMAKNLVESGKLTTFGSMFPDIMRPVFYPIMTAFVYLITDNILFSGIVVSVISGSLICALIYYISREFFDSTVSFFAGLMLAINYHLINTSVHCWSDSAALMFLLLSHLFGIKFIKNNRIIFAIISGIFFALGFLTRQIVEIHFYFFILFLGGVIIYKRSFRNAVSGIISISVPALILITPYLYHTYGETGKVVLNTGKSYSGIRSKVINYKKNDPDFQNWIVQNFSENNKNINLLYKEIGYRALDDENKDLLSFDLYFNNLSKEKHHSLVINKLKRIGISASKNATDLAIVILSSFKLFIIFLVSGSYWLLKEKKFLFIIFLTFAIFADLIFVLTSHVESRYAINIIAYSSIIISFGLKKFFKSKVFKTKPKLYYKIAFVGTLCFISVYSLFLMIKNVNRIGNSIENSNMQYSEISNLFKKEITLGSKITSRHPTIVFFIGKETKFVPLPIAPLKDTLEYFKNNDVEYIVLSPIDVELRPYLAERMLNSSKHFNLVSSISINNEKWYLLKMRG